MTKLAVLLAGTIVAALALGGCASSGSRVRVNQSEAGLPSCQTFSWHATPGSVASLTDQRVRAAVMGELKAKRYEEVDENADCRIAYFLTTREVPREKPSVGVGVGGGSGGIGGGVGVSLPVGRRAGYVGTFSLDVIDASRNAQVWSGSVDTELQGPDLSEREAHDLAKKVLAAYPDRNGAVPH